jgi:hypothetical protein
MKEFTRHPLSAIWPDQSPEEWAETERTVAAYGVKEKITIYDGLVLDGWHRYRAAKNAGQEVPHEDFVGTLEEAKEFLRRKHLARRSLTGSQRALSIAALTEWVPPSTKGGSAADPPSSAMTLADQANEAQVSETTMKAARAVVRNAIPRVKDAVRDGDLSVERAARVAQLSPRQQERALDKPKAAPARKKWTAPASLPKPEVGATKQAYDDAQEKIAILSEEHDALSDRVAVLACGGVATDEEREAYAATLSDLRARIKTLEAELAAVKSSRNSYMAESNELKKEVTKLRSQLTKYRDTK